MKRCFPTAIVLLLETREGLISRDRVERTRAANQKMFSKVSGIREGPSHIPNSKEYDSFKHALFVTEGHSGPGATESQSHMRAMDSIIIRGTWAICDSGSSHLQGMNLNSNWLKSTFWFM